MEDSASCSSDRTSTRGGEGIPTSPSTCAYIEAKLRTMRTNTSAQLSIPVDSLVLRPWRPASQQLFDQGLGVFRRRARTTRSHRLSERQTASPARISPAPIGRATPGTAFPSWSAREDQCGDEPCNEDSGDDREHSHQWGDPGRNHIVKARPFAVSAEGIQRDQ